MKKTFSINVAGFAFTIDEDAYSLLNDYLNTIENAFSRQDDAREIVSDIESRVAELLMEHASEGSPIITIAQVEEVINRIGKPEDMIEGDEETIITETSEFTGPTPPPYIPPLPPVKKKLYRDPQNAMLGGVCSGLAWYLNIDPTVVRLVTVLLTILSASTVGLAYIVMWIVVPDARTPLERIQMMGEQPTMENIAKTVTGSFKEETENVTDKYCGNSFSDSLATFFGVLAKALVIIGLIIGIPLLVVLVLGLLGCLFALVMFATDLGSAFFGETTSFWYSEAGSLPVWGVLCGIGSILVVGIPLFILVRMGLRKNGNVLSTGVRNSLVIIWILGFVLAGFSTGRIVNVAHEMDSNNFIDRIDKIEERLDKVDFDEEEIVIHTDSAPVHDVAADSTKGEKEVISITQEGIYISTDSVKMKIGK